MNNPYFDISDIFLMPLYLVLTFGIGYLVRPKDQGRLFMWGLVARMLGAFFFASIYIFYYKGGDTTAYYLTAKPFVLLFLKQPFIALEALFTPYSIEHYLLFTEETGYPLRYIYEDIQTFTISRITAPVMLISLNRYMLTTIVLGALSYIGPWKLFRVFQDASKDTKIAAISALFVPSVLFWGTGISKDTVTFTSACYLFYGFYYLLIKREFSIGKLIGSFIALYFIISVKPYVFIVLLPGAILWLLSAPSSRIKNDFLRRITLPLIGVVSVSLFLIAFQQSTSLLGDYAADQILDKAIITQEDLKRDYYGGNSFDIGEVDRSFSSILSKFPIATFYGLYGPTLIEVQNIVMLFSALENTALLLLTIIILARFRIRQVIYIFLDSPILLFCFVFSILFAFSIGFTTPNFGAMVRFKIPLLPFFVFLLLVVNNLLRKDSTN